MQNDSSPFHRTETFQRDNKVLLDGLKKINSSIEEDKALLEIAEEDYDLNTEFSPKSKNNSPSKFKQLQ